MIIIKRKNCTYYITEESITLQYNLQLISFNVYMLQNRKKFKEFKRTLMESSPEQYDNINDIIGLASRYKLLGMTGYKPEVDEANVVYME